MELVVIVVATVEKTMMISVSIGVCVNVGIKVVLASSVGICPDKPSGAAPKFDATILLGTSRTHITAEQRCGATVRCDAGNNPGHNWLLRDVPSRFCSRPGFAAATFPNCTPTQTTYRHTYTTTALAPATETSHNKFNRRKKRRKTHIIPKQ